MCRLVASWLLVLVLNTLTVFSAEFRLTNGDVYVGEAASYNDDGLVVRLEIGGFSPRIAWGKLTQETLKEIAQNPQAAEIVEPYIEIPLEVRQAEKQKRKEIKVIDPPRVPLPEGKTGFFASLANPVGLFLLGVLYLANLYAAYEIARFRGRPIALVVGVSAIAPIIAPTLFALLPSGQVEAGTADAAEPAATEAVNPMAQALPSGMSGGGLGLAAAHGAKAGANSAYGQVYNRGNTTFDRRFFETKFTGFFRVVPGDAEKDLVMVIKTPKSEIVATRISRISGVEAHFQLLRGSEMNVPFGEMTEVSTRAKGAK